MRKYVEIVMAFPGACTDQINEKENYILYPAIIMREKGFTPEIWTLWKKGLEREEYVKGVKVKRFNNMISILFNLLINKEVKLVHAFLRPFIPSLLSSLIFNKPRMITPVTYELGSTKLIEKISLFFLRKFNKILTLTPYEYNIYLKNDIPKERIELLPFCIDYKFFSKKLNVQKIRKKYNIKNNEFVIVSVANFRKFKNLDVMLRAFKLFHEKVKHSKFIVVGKDMLKSDMFKDQRKQSGPCSIKEIVSSLGIENDVIITGSLNSDKVREIHKTSDLFVNISDPEAQGIAVYEAAASGLPLCLSDIGSFKTVFKDNALYSNPRNAKILSENYLKYFSKPDMRKKHSLALRKQMKAWDYKVIHKKLSNIFDKLLQIY